MPEKILIVAAHPDDEVLNDGGTIARFTHQESESHVIFMFAGRRRCSQDGMDSEVLQRSRKAERKVVNSLGFNI